MLNLRIPRLGTGHNNDQEEDEMSWSESIALKLNNATEMQEMSWRSGWKGAKRMVLIPLGNTTYPKQS